MSEFCANLVLIFSFSLDLFIHCCDKYKSSFMTEYLLSLNLSLPIPQGELFHDAP